MERFHAHVGSRDAALQQAPEVLQPVSVNLPIDIFLGMVDDLMSVVLSQPVVRLERIRIQRRPSFDVLFHASMESLFLPVINYHSANLAATFQRTEHNGFVFAASTSDAALTFVEMHVTSLAADESFIDLDFTAELTKGFILQSQTNAMQHEPCGFLSDTEIAGQFAGANAVLAVCQQPKSGHPLVESDGGIFAEAPDLDGEFALRMMLGASPSAAL